MKQLTHEFAECTIITNEYKWYFHVVFFLWASMKSFHDYPLGLKKVTYNLKCTIQIWWILSKLFPCALTFNINALRKSYRVKVNSMIIFIHQAQVDVSLNEMSDERVKKRRSWASNGIIFFCIKLHFFVYVRQWYVIMLLRQQLLRIKCKMIYYE